MSPSLALAAYAETWISGAKVIVFGDSLSPLPERLVERGARLVQVYDRDAARAAEATALEHSRQISYAPLDSAGSVARDGVFDFGIVEDLTAVDRAAGPLPVLRKALGRRGMALIAARNPEVTRCLIPTATDASEPLGYYDLYEHVSAHFDEVRMLGQTAFVGYAVADFGAAEDSDVRLDTAFLPGGAEEPEWFLALVSTLPVSSEAFSVIQIPLADVPAPSADRAEVESLEQALERAESRVAELEKAKLQSDGARQAREPRDAEHKAQLQTLQTELNKREQWLAALEARATTADQRADDMQAELDQLAAKNAQATRELASLNTQSTRDLAAQSAQATRDLAAQNTQASRELAALNAQNTQASRELAALNAQNTRANRELAALNAQNAQANQELTALKAEHAQTARELAALNAQHAQTTRELAGISAQATRDRERLEQRLAEESSAKKALEESRASLQRELDVRSKSEAAATRASAELERRASALTKNVERLEAELRSAEVRLREASELAKAEPDTELAQVEAMLVERGAEVSRLSLALEQTERFGRQLIAELGLLKAAASAATAPVELERLARRNAELEADLEAARWTISSLGANGAAAGGTSLAARREDASPTARRSAD